MNPDSKPTLGDTHRLLVETHHDFSKRLDGETDPQKARAILDEMQKLLHRINKTQELLLKEGLGELKSEREAVEQAGAELRRNLKELRELNHVLETSTLFLRAVDQLLSLASKVLRG